MQYLINSYSFKLIKSEHTGNKMVNLSIGLSLIKLEISSANAFKDLPWVSPNEWFFSVNQLIKEDTQGPNVSLKALHLFLKRLRGHVDVSSRHLAQPNFISNQTGPAEITEFNA